MRARVANLHRCGVLLCLSIGLATGQAFAGLRLVDRIILPGNPRFAEYNSANGLLYVTDTPNGTQLSAIAPLPLAVVATIQINENMGRLGINPTTNRIYVPGQTRLFVLDAATHTLITSIPLLVQNAGAAAVNPLTNRVYVSMPTRLAILDGATNALITSLPLPGTSSISAVAVNTRTNRIYVANEGTDNITVVDGASNSVVATIQLLPTAYPRDLAVDEAANRIFVAQRIPSVMTAISGVTNAIVDTARTPDFPLPVAFDPALHVVYTACATNELVVCAAAKLSNMVRVRAGGQRIMDDLVIVGDRLYVPDPQNHEIAVFADANAPTAVRTTTWGRLKRLYR
jgi:YVTN family beta-propeller protein